MRLARTRQLVHCLGESLQPWPDLWPAGPEVAKDAGRALWGAIGVEQSDDQFSSSQLHMALDEWLLSMDRDRLSVLQRAVFGCASLELFASSSVSRDTLSIDTALTNIAPAITAMPHEALTSVYSLINDLYQRRAIAALDYWESAILVAARYCIGEMSDNHVESDGFEAAVKVIVQEASEDEMSRDTLRCLAEEVQSWQQVGQPTRSLLFRSCREERT